MYHIMDEKGYKILWNIILKNACCIMYTYNINKKKDIEILSDQKYDWLLEFFLGNIFLVYQPIPIYNILWKRYESWITYII